jgi:hypothetical protein
MNKTRPFFAVGLGLLISVTGLISPVAFAATQPSPANSGQALEIAPPVITLSGNPGQVIKTQINLRDVSSVNLLVSAQVNDFVAAGEDGTPKILLKDEGNNPYSIINWVTPLSDLLMIPHQIKTLPVTITIPADASPGGHYGVVRFTATPPELKGTGVSLSASLGSLMLINVNGKVKESLSIQEFSVNHGGVNGKLFESTPVNFVVRLKNSGNTHEQPVGQITVTDMFGKKVASVNINLPPRNVLPQSIRKFSSPLDSSVIGNKKLFGHYRANMVVTYGANKQTTTASTSFWIIPYRLIGAAIILLVGGFFGLRYFITGYNRRIINKSQTTKRK